jgi:hypothetical protein
MPIDAFAEKFRLALGRAPRWRSVSAWTSRSSHAVGHRGLRRPGAAPQHDALGALRAAYRDVLPGLAT